MKKETLHIKNFGPIKEVNLELGKVNVFIGDQGTGKSTIAKVICALKAIDNSNNNIGDTATNEILFKNNYENLLKVFDLSNLLNDDSFVKYENNYGIITISNKEVRKSVFGHLILVNESFQANYIIAERNYVSLLANAMFSLNELGTKLPTLFNRFGNKYAAVRAESTKYYRDILGVDFQNINGVDSVIINDYSKIPLTQASSGIQGTIPLLVVYESLINESNTNFNNGNKTENLIVIEEPEINLFPETQHKLLKHLLEKNIFNPLSALVVDIKDDSKPSKTVFFTGELLNQLVITTHSPYILTSLNNLMYAYKVANMQPEYFKKVESIIDQKYWLNPSDIRVYKLSQSADNNGCIAESILDYNEGMIDATAIDGISEILNEEFNQLIDIELNR